MSDRNVAIIGCGYVGTAVAKTWKPMGLSLTVTTTTPDRVSELEPIADRVAIVRGDDPAGLISVLRDCHCALLSIGAKGGDYEQTYLKTARTLVSIWPELPDLRQVIYTGSYGIYGDRTGADVDETTPVLPATDKHRILHQTEETLLSASDDNHRVCILRLGGIYGPGRTLARIFSRAAGSTRPGAGEEVTNWVHLDDIVGAIEFARDRQLQGIYNVVDDSHLLRRELIDRVCEQNGLAKVTWDGSRPSSRSTNVRVSNQKLKDAGYSFVRPQIVLE